MKTFIQNSVIFQVKKLREANGYSQKRLADVLGISNGQIGNIESCHKPHKYTLQQLYTICQEFHISIQHLFLTEEEIVNTNNIIDALILKIIEYGKQEGNY